MLDPRQPEEPEELALQKEDERALAAALARLPAPEREPLVAHDVEGVTTAALAERLGTTPGALAVRLSRARARLRVEYLLTLRRAELPSPKCKRVLLTLSTGLKRDQLALGAGEHLVGCPTCASLSQPLLHRRRTLAMIWPLVGVEALARWLRRAARSHPRPTAAVAFSAVVLVAVAVMALRPDDRPDPTLWVEASSPIPLSGAEPMAPHAGKVVVARGVRVQSVADPAGFWVGGAPAERVWVDVHDNAEPPRLTAGQRVSFRGTVVANTPETLETAGRSSPGDRAQLEQQGFHIDIAGDTLQPISSRE